MLRSFVESTASYSLFVFSLLVSLPLSLFLPWNCVADWKMTGQSRRRQHRRLTPRHATILITMVRWFQIKWNWIGVCCPLLDFTLRFHSESDYLWFNFSIPLFLSPSPSSTSSIFLFFPQSPSLCFSFSFSWFNRVSLLDLLFLYLNHSFNWILRLQ